MSETTKPTTTNPLAKGEATSEYKLTKQVIISALATAFMGILGALALIFQDRANNDPNAPFWVPVAMTVIGFLSATAAKYSYDKGRSTQKVGIMQAIGAGATDVLQQILAGSKVTTASSTIITTPTTTNPATSSDATAPRP